MSQSLDGQSILVTGASGGIGAAIVERLASEGARPIIHYGRDGDGAEALLSRIGGHGFIVQAEQRGWSLVASAVWPYRALVSQGRWSTARMSRVSVMRSSPS